MGRGIPSDRVVRPFPHFAGHLAFSTPRPCSWKGSVWECFFILIFLAGRSEDVRVGTDILSLGLAEYGCFLLVTVKVARRHFSVFERGSMDLSRPREVVRLLLDMCLEMREPGMGSLLDVASRYAYALHADLVRAGLRIVPGKIWDRRTPLHPDDPRFFQCLETLEEFAALAADAVTLPPTA
jgi:hypothetical protein